MKAHARADLAQPDLLELLKLNEAGFKSRFAGSPVLRTKRRGLLRNVCVALGNTGDESILPALERAAAEYADAAKPLLAKYCLECHSTEVMEGDLDLERFAALGDVRKATAVWLKVAEMLDNRDLPRQFPLHTACR